MILKNSNRLPKSAPIPELKIYLIKPFKGPRKEQYELIKSPSSKFSIPIELECISVFYKFKGKQFIESFPSSLSFGEIYLTHPFIKEDQPVYDIPLIIWDTRNSKTFWTLTVTLEQPLTSEENPSEILSRPILYKVNDLTKYLYTKVRHNQLKLEQSLDQESIISVKSGIQIIWGTIKCIF